MKRLIMLLLPFFGLTASLSLQNLELRHRCNGLDLSEGIEYLLHLDHAMLPGKELLAELFASMRWDVSYTLIQRECLAEIVSEWLVGGVGEDDAYFCVHIGQKTSCIRYLNQQLDRPVQGDSFNVLKHLQKLELWILFELEQCTALTRERTLVWEDRWRKACASLQEQGISYSFPIIARCAGVFAILMKEDAPLHVAPGRLTYRKLGNEFTHITLNTVSLETEDALKQWLWYIAYKYTLTGQERHLLNAACEGDEAQLTAQIKGCLTVVGDLALFVALCCEHERCVELVLQELPDNEELTMQELSYRLPLLTRELIVAVCTCSVHAMNVRKRLTGINGNGDVQNAKEEILQDLMVQCFELVPSRNALELVLSPTIFNNYPPEAIKEWCLSCVDGEEARMRDLSWCATDNQQHLLVVRLMVARFIRHGELNKLQILDTYPIVREWLVFEPTFLKLAQSAGHTDTVNYLKELSF